MAQSDQALQLPETQAIAEQRSALAEEKKVILDQFQTASKACWKQQKYQALTPLDQREMALNERQRVLKESERQQRISGKNQETPKDKALP